MAVQCPNCTTPVPTERRVFRAWLFAKWRCKRCGSLLGFNKGRRIAAVAAVGIVAFLLLQLIQWFVKPGGFPRQMILVGCLAIFAALSMMQLEGIVVLERCGFFCGHCGYDLSGSPARVCPECGKAVPEDVAANSSNS